jgi:hypothetical protein
MNCIFEHTRLRRTRGVVARLILTFSFIGVQVALSQQSGNAPSTDASQAVPTKDGGDLASRANDPSAPLKQLNFYDSYNPAYLGSQGEGNMLLIRPVLPAQSRGWFPATITRPTIPVVSLPDGRSGLGDLSFTSLFFPFDGPPHTKTGIGEALTLPTTSSSLLGQGKWQLGPAALVIYTGVRSLVVGALVENPISFAGESRRRDVNAMTLQPLIVKAFRGGYFVRTDPILNFDWERGGAATIPVNLALGKVLKIGCRPVSAYIQPEWTVHHPTFPGSVTPKFTLRLSCTFLYPAKRS